MSDADDQYRFTSRRTIPWRSYKAMPLGFEVSPTRTLTTVSATAGVLTLIDEVKNLFYPEVRQGFRETTQAILRHSAVNSVRNQIQRQLVEGQTVQVTMRLSEHDYSVRIDRPRTEYNQDGPNMIRFSVTKPGSQCEILHKETSRFELRNKELPEYLDNDRPRVPDRSEKPTTLIPAILKRLTEPVEVKPICRENINKFERERKEVEEEEARTHMP
tara:strand:+ start:7079 stop:7726 length:648 start_codon:yes stop_codon:yes gene_type:complete